MSPSATVALSYHVSKPANAPTWRPSVRLTELPVPIETSSERINSEGSSMPHDRGRISGTFTARMGRNVPAFEITHGDYLKKVQKAFRIHAGNRPGAAKEIASELECSDKAVKSWLDGRTAPSGVLCCRAMNRIPAYAALKREIAAMETDMDPRLQAKYQELHRLTLELAGAP